LQVANGCKDEDPMKIWIVDAEATSSWVIKERETGLWRQSVAERTAESGVQIANY
jgi:hypothetical protein